MILVGQPHCAPHRHPPSRGARQAALQHTVLLDKVLFGGVSEVLLKYSWIYMFYGGVAYLFNVVYIWAGPLFLCDCFTGRGPQCVAGLGPPRIVGPVTIWGADSPGPTGGAPSGWSPRQLSVLSGGYWLKIS